MCNPKPNFSDILFPMQVSLGNVKGLVIVLGLNFGEITGEKARWELHKDVACCFEQILEAAAYKTAVVRPLTSHLTNHPSKMNKTCFALLEE